MNILKSLSIIAIISCVIVSCGGNNKTNDATTTTNPPTYEPVKEQSAITETGSHNWDKVIEDYDKFVTDYIKFYKKAIKGDQSALSEYPKLMEKATKLSESLQKAQTDNQLTAKQITRITEIGNKMVNAALENK